VISSSGAENRSRWSEIDCPHLEITTFSSIPTMLLSMLSFTRFARMRRFARSFAPDVIYYTHGHAWKPLLDLVLPRSAKTVLTVHDPELHAGEDSVLHRALDAGNRLHVDGYVLLNDSQRRSFVERLHLDPAQVAVVAHGVLDDVVVSCRPLADVPGLADLAPWSGRYLLFVGRIQPYKGLATLLAAYSSAAVDRDGPLVIAGSGVFSAAEAELLAKMPMGSVIVLNKWLTEIELASIVSAARFVVLPYLSATQSGVIPLASAFGVPAIASKIGGVAEQVVDGRTGLLFPAGDTESLAARLRLAITMSSEKYERMASRCREHAAVAWNWDHLAEQVLSFLAGL